MHGEILDNKQRLVHFLRPTVLTVQRRLPRVRISVSMQIRGLVELDFLLFDAIENVLAVGG